MNLTLNILDWLAINGLAIMLCIVILSTLLKGGDK
jgi:hypothetical protein